MVTKRYLLMMPKTVTSTPIVYNMVKDYDLVVNIIRAKITAEEEGYIAVDVKGLEENIAKAIVFLSTLDIKVNENFKGIQWDSQKCTGCGSCLTHCPKEALHVKDRATMEVDFDSHVCIECMNCIEVCPFGACSSLF